MIILSLLNGSKLYGLDTSTSDIDIINIFVKDRKDYYINEPDKILRRKWQNYDITYIDLLVFCRQLIKCNPNFLIPLLEGKSLYEDRRGVHLLNYSFAFLDYANIHRAFSGMAMSLMTKDNRTAECIIGYKNMLLEELTPSTQTNKDAIKKMIDYILDFKNNFYNNN